ncbi:hypothetical protein A2U01_0068402 [Trifolium medium]|uniref:Uncharacterized protein n=1 Tax=Trifolium medium TaxID=97028 RepID=A0A392SE27_9FABA|nr:hypothetical protein [Trifolium medium]
MPSKKRFFPKNSKTTHAVNTHLRLAHPSLRLEQKATTKVLAKVGIEPSAGQSAPSAAGSFQNLFSDFL